MIQGSQGALSFQKDLSHMGYVKQAHFRPHCHVLRQNALSILHRHDIAAKRDHFPFQGQVTVI